MKKKAKRYQGGGLASIADTVNSLMNDVDNMANTINYGSEGVSSSSQPVGFSAIGGFKKGGYVKVADGCAQRGKTRGKIV